MFEMKDKVWCRGGDFLDFCGGHSRNGLLCASSRLRLAIPFPRQTQSLALIPSRGHRVSSSSFSNVPLLLLLRQHPQPPSPWLLPKRRRRGGSVDAATIPSPAVFSPRARIVRPGRQSGENREWKLGSLFKRAHSLPVHAICPLLWVWHAKPHLESLHFHINRPRCALLFPPLVFLIIRATQ
jgi:hypothetical protein